MHLSSYRLIGDYHAQHPFVAYTLHDRAGTLASFFIYDTCYSDTNIDGHGLY